MCRDDTIDKMFIDTDEAVANILIYNRKEDQTIEDAVNITEEQREEIIDQFAETMREFNK